MEDKISDEGANHNLKQGYQQHQLCQSEDKGPSQMT